MDLGTVIPLTPTWAAAVRELAQQVTDDLRVIGLRAEAADTEQG